MAPTILVVDDHPETRALIERTLHPQGYKVVAVADGEAALAAAAADQPDLIIADILLPGMDGLRVIETLRQQNLLLPVIAISAVHRVLEQPDWMPAELDPASIVFLAKPFSLASLLALVHQVLPLPLLS